MQEIAAPKIAEQRTRGGQGVLPHGFRGIVEADNAYGPECSGAGCGYGDKIATSHIQPHIFPANPSVLGRHNLGSINDNGAP
jgi:hypothetical protein